MPDDKVTQRLSAQQVALLERWLPGAEVRRDHSWGLVETWVLEVAHDGCTYIVKAGGPDDHHNAREIHAHQHWTRPLVDMGAASRLVHHDVDAKLLVTTYLPGVLVQGSPAQDDTDVFRQAGRLLRVLHDQPGEVDASYEARQNARALQWLDSPHRIEPSAEARLRELIAGWDTSPAVLVPTHGDWQTRNWLIDQAVVRAIDFGRADLRPAYTDFARVDAREFCRDRSLDAAFVEGYGADPRADDPAVWQRNRVREAIGTAAWAFTVGDEKFEAEGHRMIAAVLADDD